MQVLVWAVSTIDAMGSKPGGVSGLRDPNRECGDKFEIAQLRDERLAYQASF